MIVLAAQVFLCDAAAAAVPVERVLALSGSLVAAVVAFCGKLLVTSLLYCVVSRSDALLYCRRLLNFCSLKEAVIDVQSSERS